MIGGRVIVNTHIVKFGSRSVCQLVSATLGLPTLPRVTDTDDSRESPLRYAFPDRSESGRGTIQGFRIQRQGKCRFCRVLSSARGGAESGPMEGDDPKIFEAKIQIVVIFT